MLILFINRTAFGFLCTFTFRMKGIVVFHTSQMDNVFWGKMSILIKKQQHYSIKSLFLFNTSSNLRKPNRTLITVRFKVMKQNYLVVKDRSFGMDYVTFEFSFIVILCQRIVKNVHPSN